MHGKQHKISRVAEEPDKTQADTEIAITSGSSTSYKVDCIKLTR